MLGKFRHKAAAAAVLLLAGMLFVTAGCGEEKKPAKPTQAEAKIAFAPVTEVKEGRKNIYAALKVVKGNYWQKLAEGLKAGGEACNVNVYVGGPAKETDWQLQKAMIEELQGKKADAIIMSPCESTNMIPVANTLREKKIPVILVDTPLNDKVYDAAYMTDNAAAGAKAAEEMLNILKKSGLKEDAKAVVAVAASSLNSHTLVGRSEGIKAYWEKNAPKAWVLAPDILINYSDPKLARNLAEEAVKKHGDLKGFITINNSSTVATVKYMKEAGLKKVSIVGFDYSPEIAELIANADFAAASVVQNQYNMGFEAVKTANDLLQGKKPAQQDVDTGVKIVNAGNYKEFEAKK